MAKDLHDLSLSELNDHIAEATKIRDEKVAARRKELLAELHSLGGVPNAMAPGGGDVVGNGLMGKARAKPPVTHRDDKGNTWTSRGALPKWLRAYEDEGRNREEFRVKD